MVNKGVIRDNKEKSKGVIIGVLIWGAKNPQPQFFQVLHVLITLSILCIIHEITWQPEPIKPIPCSLPYIFNSYSLYHIL